MKVTAEEFKERIASLCLGGLGPGMPRRERDRHIFLKSAALLLGHGREYAEAALNRLLESWLLGLGPGVRVDHVSLRRYLVDEGYMTRDAAGNTYEVCASDAGHGLFDSDVDGVDAMEVVKEARARQEESRRLHEASISDRQSD